MFSGLLGFSAPVSLTSAPAAVSMAPAPVVEYGCGRVHNARACRVRDTSSFVPARAVAVIAAPASVVVHRASVCRVIRGIRVLIWKIGESIEAHCQASLKWRRIQMENHTPRIRAISHGMKLRPFTWFRELYRNSRCSKSSRATSLMEDVRRRLANNLRLCAEHCRWN